VAPVELVLGVEEIAALLLHSFDRFAYESALHEVRRAQKQGRPQRLRFWQAVSGAIAVRLEEESDPSLTRRSPI
jgi:hypothetical protein